MTEFRAALVRKGFRRVDIDEIYGRGKAKLEVEQRDPRGKSIIRHARPVLIHLRRRHRRFDHERGSRTRTGATTVRRQRPIHTVCTKSLQIQRDFVTTHAQGQGKQAAQLRSAKSNLERAYAQEQNVQLPSSRSTGVISEIPGVVAGRARAERRYVNCLVRYLRDTNQMSAMEAKQLQGSFTKHKMGDCDLNNRVYLLGKYTFELN